MNASALPAVSQPHRTATNLMHKLSSELRLPNNRLHSFTRLREDLFLDTMDIELLLASLESGLEYYLTEEEANQIETVGDLQHYFLR
ncbi:acyl carrier protein [Neolewinella xylanilytica]|uniref:Acyl carrier protein n=1 Tax=Neolewinella xylanilytica TaxID=1514080 RepID=A0A2S6I3M7_9BACT|nr:hypothetical protein [Neolewinella xylanilytica]PPK85777.1 acyl carrier protein [Neolewinella xylanilytica]